MILRARDTCQCLFEICPLLPSYPVFANPLLHKTSSHQTQPGSTWLQLGTKSNGPKPCYSETQPSLRSLPLPARQHASTPASPPLCSSLLGPRNRAQIDPVQTLETLYKKRSSTAHLRAPESRLAPTKRSYQVPPPTEGDRTRDPRKRRDRERYRGRQK